MKKKEVAELTVNEQMDHAIGRMIVSIGKGDFQSTARLYLLDMHSRGFQAGRLEIKPKAKPRVKK